MLCPRGRKESCATEISCIWILSHAQIVIACSKVPQTDQIRRTFFLGNMFLSFAFWQIRAKSDKWVQSSGVEPCIGLLPNPKPEPWNLGPAESGVGLQNQDWMTM